MPESTNDINGRDDALTQSVAVYFEALFVHQNRHMPTCKPLPFPQSQDNNSIVDFCILCVYAIM